MLSADLSPKLGTVGAQDRPPGPSSAACGFLGSHREEGRGPHWAAAVWSHRKVWGGGGEGLWGTCGAGGRDRGGAGSTHRTSPHPCLVPGSLVAGTWLRGNGFCMKRDTNLFGQIIHHFKRLLWLGGLPLLGP